MKNTSHSPEVTVSFSAQGGNEAQTLTILLAIGLCRAIAEGIVTPGFACRRFFDPVLLDFLERIKVSSEVMDAVNMGLDLEFVEDLIPESTRKSALNTEACLLEALRKVLPQERAPGRWLRQE